jgi:glycosyltransferase involved in cell wall biosynthesis
MEVNLGNDPFTRPTDVSGWRASDRTVSARGESPVDQGDAGSLRQSLERELAAARERNIEERKRHLEEATRRLTSPEWVIGDWLWNRVRLRWIGVPAARYLRTLLDRCNRVNLILGRVRSRLLRRRRAVVTSCWAFPVHSHTFVYQEMQAFKWAHLHPTVFCCRTNSRDQLQPAFKDLWRSRNVLKAEWSICRSDLDHFRRTRPDRVRSLLQRLTTTTNWTEEALLQNPVVGMGFSFARHVELAGADYIHSYFFYDQSLMALMAAYLLGIPRGVTAYADHMLTDFPLKCVPLHLELADIVVATSHRIKMELSAIGGGRFDTKILVKPNGIDTSRFAAPATATRNGVPELIAVNRIEPKKGLGYLVDAIRILQDRDVPVLLNLVGGVDKDTIGSVECFRELQARIDDLGIANRVVMHGAKKQPEILGLLQRSNVFVAPYIEVESGDKDGIPTSMLEAMSTALPVVVTDAGSILEVVRDDRDALVVPQRDALQLADAIERLIKDPELRARLGEAGRRRVTSEYDVHVTEARLHERILATLAETGRKD